MMPLHKAQKGSEWKDRDPAFRGRNHKSRYAWSWKAWKDLCEHLYWALEHEFSVIKALDGTEGFATTETDEPDAWPE